MSKYTQYHIYDWENNKWINLQVNEEQFIQEFMNQFEQYIKNKNKIIIQKENITPKDVVQIDIQPMHDYENKKTILKSTITFKK